MHLLHAAVHPKTQGLGHCTNLIDPHATIPDATKVPPHNRATMVADREVVGKEVVVEGTLLMEGVTKMVGLTMILGVAIAPMVRAIPITMGEILGTDPSRRHVPPGAIPMIW